MHITIRPQKGEFSISFMLRHDTWHGTLCEVQGPIMALTLPLIDSNINSIDKRLRDFVASSIPELQTLWHDYPIFFPVKTMGRKHL